eukprot:2158281-Rhodomonas_salina.2
MDMDDEVERSVDRDQGNPAFKAPMQLLRPSPCHQFLELVEETMDALRSVDSEISVVTGGVSLRALLHETSS